MPLSLQTSEVTSPPHLGAGASGSWALDPSGHRGFVNQHADQLMDFDQSTNTQHTSEPVPSQDQETAVKFPLSKSHKLI